MNNRNYNVLGEKVSFAQTEKHYLSREAWRSGIYGSSRLGVNTDRVELLGTQNDTYSMDGLQHHIGAKNYELTNHLGNVLSVISDKIVPEESPGGGTVTAFNDQFTVNGDLLGWFYDPTATGNPPMPGYSLNASGGQLILQAGAVYENATKDFNIPTDASFTVSFDLELNGGAEVMAGGPNVGFNFYSTSGTYTLSGTGVPGPERFGFYTAPGYTVIIDNVKVEYAEPSAVTFLADIRQSTDYSPFGVKLEKRDLKLTSSSGNVIPYRYGFQNQEEDDELKGEGNSVNFEFRMHDPRLGRFFAIDPLTSKYAHNSPYAFSENNVIHCKELEGAEKIEAYIQVEHNTPEAKNISFLIVQYDFNIGTIKVIHGLESPTSTNSTITEYNKNTNFSSSQSSNLPIPEKFRGLYGKILHPESFKLADGLGIIQDQIDDFNMEMGDYYDELGLNSNFTGGIISQFVNAMVDLAGNGSIMVSELPALTELKFNVSSNNPGVGIKFEGDPWMSFRFQTVNPIDLGDGYSVRNMIVDYYNQEPIMPMYPIQEPTTNDQDTHNPNNYGVQSSPIPPDGSPIPFLNE